MSFFSMFYPKENIHKINFNDNRILLKNNYSEMDNRRFCSRYAYILSKYSYYDSEVTEFFIGSSSAIRENNKKIMLPYITIYVQHSNGNHFNTMFKISFKYFLYYLNFWGNKKIMEALIYESEIFSTYSDSYCMPIFNSDKVLFSIL